MTFEIDNKTFFTTTGVQVFGKICFKLFDVIQNDAFVSFAIFS